MSLGSVSVLAGNSGEFGIVIHACRGGLGLPRCLSFRGSSHRLGGDRSTLAQLLGLWLRLLWFCRYCLAGHGSPRDALGGLRVGKRSAHCVFRYDEGRRFVIDGWIRYRTELSFNKCGGLRTRARVETNSSTRITQESFSTGL